ncbi:MAG TPA: ankyrin repeat domain-containing protein [Rhizomicrobium sp.]|jgi:ankyrin repeat protein
MPYANLKELLDYMNTAMSGYADLDNDLVDVNQRDVFGDTPLGIAVIWGDVEAVRLLLEGGADVNARQADDMTPLHYTAIPKTGGAEVAKLLLEAGASLDIVDDLFCKTPLEYAAKRDEVAQVLREAEQARKHGKASD